jgi:hypothetical protein
MTQAASAFAATVKPLPAFEVPGRFLSHINLGVGVIYFQKRQPYMYATLLLKQEGGERYDRP